MGATTVASLRLIVYSTEFPAAGDMKKKTNQPTTHHISEIKNPHFYELLQDKLTHIFPTSASR